MDKVLLPGILTNPIKWFISIPIRVFILAFFALIVPFGTIIIALVILFSNWTESRKDSDSKPTSPEGS